MTDKYNDEIIEEENQDTDDQTDDYEPEKFCTLCHRSERQAGKMIDLPNNIHICPDCMQRSFDAMSSSPLDAEKFRQHEYTDAEW